MGDCFWFQCQAFRTSWSHGYSFRWIRKSWYDRINLFFCCRIQFYDGSALPISQKLLSKKMPLQSRVFWPWTALGTARMSSWRRRQKAGKEMSAVSSLKQPGCPKWRKALTCLWGRKAKVQVCDRSRSSWLFPGILHHLLIDIMSAECLPMNLSSRISPSLRDNSSQAAAPVFAMFTSVQAQAVQERDARTPSPCYWAKKGISRQHLSQAGVRRWGRIRSD